MGAMSCTVDVWSVVMSSPPEYSNACLILAEDGRVDSPPHKRSEPLPLRAPDADVA